MISLSIRGAAALILVLANGPVSVAAQTSPTTLPTPLVVALLGPGPTPRFVVGEAPPDFPPEWLPPAEWRIVGAAVRRNNSTLVIDSPLPAAEAVAFYTRFLERSGWTRRPSPTDRGGFMDGTRADWTPLCHGGASIGLTPVAPPAGAGSYLNARFTWDSRTCDETNDPRIPLPPELYFPALRNPPSADSRGGGGGSSDNYSEISTRLITNMSGRELLAYYAPQIVAGGWTVGDPVFGNGVAAQPVVGRDKKGATWHGTLLVVDIGNQRDVLLRMSRPDTRR